MDFPYTPKLVHAIVTAFLCIASLALGSFAQGRLLTALIVGGIIFALMTALILWGLFLESGNRRAEVQAEWMDKFSRLDDEGRAAVAFQFPSIRYRMRRGELRAFFEDTNVPIEQFRYFLQTSDARSISPERLWSTREHPRRVWLEIKLWLEEHDYIIPYSAAGNHSWLWEGNSYQHLVAYWMAGKDIRNLNKVYSQQEAQYEQAERA